MPDDFSPAGSNALAAALDWLQNTLLGTVATSIAVIAVAGIGLLMLAGRIDIRRAVQVVLGCFILFDALAIASGIIGAVYGSGGKADLDPSVLPPLPAAVPSGGTPYDPYAGAAVPPR